MQINCRIVVDADACPVKHEIAVTARTFTIPVIMVSSYDHLIREEEGVTAVQVDRSDQSADIYIANHIKHGDVVVTQDYGLAALALAKGCYVLSNRGLQYGDDNIDLMLDRRHHQAKARRMGKHSKGPKPITADDKMLFQHNLTKLLEKMQENDDS
ncbi:YaiI/YqxD family protein [Paenibacillus sp. CMAA1364]